MLGALAQAEELGTGNLLVATRKSVDPELAKTVVLLVHFDEQGAIGLVVNRPSNVPMSEVFPALKTAAVRFLRAGRSPLEFGRCYDRDRSQDKRSMFSPTSR